MAKAKSKSEPTPAPILAIDPTSPEIVLEYTGGRTPRGVPARDLHGNDLARILYHRTAAANRRSRSNLIAAGEERTPVSRPAPPTADELEELAAELSSSGSFARNLPGTGEPPEAVNGDSMDETEGELGDLPAITTDAPDANPPPADPAPEPEG